MTEIDRRTFIGGAAFALLGGALPETVLADGRRLYAAARREKDGSYRAVIFEPGKGDVATVSLPERGHDVAVHPLKKHVVVFARRPGRFAVVLPVNSSQASTMFHAKEGRHFYGHGVFSPDGRLLYTTENDYDVGSGVIGVRDVANGYKQIGEFSSHGVGPHDLAFLSDGKTLVVANGGIQTHPDAGREILNRAEMEPSLCFVNIANGDLKERHVLDKSLHQLSIRHLDVAKGDVVVFGCQHKGEVTDKPNLVGFCKMGERPVLARAPEGTRAMMRNYVGSVSADKSGTIVAASSPKGGLVTFWDVEKRAFVKSWTVRDGCGVASTRQKGEFLITSGYGEIARADMKTRIFSSEDSSDVSWDNHLIKL